MRISIRSIFVKTLIHVSLLVFISACASKPETSDNFGPDPLDTVIRETSDYLNDRLTKGIKLVYLNFQSESPALSEYIIDGLIENTVNDNVFTWLTAKTLLLSSRK